jgi:hypothetical protein
MLHSYPQIHPENITLSKWIHQIISQTFSLLTQPNPMAHVQCVCPPSPSQGHRPPTRMQVRLASIQLHPGRIAVGRRHRKWRPRGTRHTAEGVATARGKALGAAASIATAWGRQRAATEVKCNPATESEWSRIGYAVRGHASTVAVPRPSRRRSLASESWTAAAWPTGTPRPSSAGRHWTILRHQSSSSPSRHHYR